MDRSARTPIDPRNIRGFANILNVRGDHSAPDYIDMSAVIPVIDIRDDKRPDLNNNNMYYCYEPAGIGLAGLQTKTLRLVSYMTLSGPNQQIVYGRDENLLIWGVKWFVQTNAAGAAALNGKHMAFEMEMMTEIPRGAGYWWHTTKFHATIYCSSGIEHYDPGCQRVENLTRDNLCVVPNGSELQITNWMQDGSNFPANTFVWYCVVAQAYPLGVIPPAVV